MLKKSLIIILCFIFALSITACNNTNHQNTQEQVDSQNESSIDEQALEVINTCSAIYLIDENLFLTGAVQDVSIGTVLADMFENPLIDIEKSGDSNAVVTISGKYRFSPDQGYYQSGTIGFNVGLEDGFCGLQSNPDNIYESMQYYTLCMVGYY